MGAFSDLVNRDALTLLNPPDYVFLCGGRLDDLKHSLRAHFYNDRVKGNPLLERRIVLAEKADEWYQSRKLFDDLLELEEYLAGLSACILLFVESPGAIAELGAFSQMELLKGKLVVVVESTYHKQQSFIRNGPIESLRRYRAKSILPYPWLTHPSVGVPEIDTGLLSDTLRQIEKAVEAELTNRRKSTSFLQQDHGHRMLLVADLIKLGVVVQASEIRRLLSDLQIRIQSKQLKQYLYLLEQLGIIASEPYGHATYYISCHGTPDHVGYAPKSPADRARLRAILQSDLAHDDHRKRALDAFNRRATGGAAI